MHDFSGGKDGAYPDVTVEDSHGNLYGVASEGGNTTPECKPLGCGVVFKLNRNKQLSVLHTFTGSPEGWWPLGVLMDPTGNLYGTTVEGGTQSCGTGVTCGIIFKIDTLGKETILHNFVSGSDGSYRFSKLSTREASRAPIPRAEPAASGRCSN